MAQSEEQRAAEQAADKAIAELLAAYNRDSAAAGATPLTWVIIVESITVDDGGDVETEFTDLLSNHTCRFTTAKGLLVIGSEQLEAEEE